MPILHKTEKLRFYQVAETINEKGFYSLEPFENDAFNQTFDVDEIDDEIGSLLGLCGSGLIVEARERSGKNLSISFNEDGNVFIRYDGNSIEIRNITDKIIADPDNSIFFIWIDGDFSKYRWFVVKLHEVVYSDI